MEFAKCFTSKPINFDIFGAKLSNSTLSHLMKKQFLSYFPISMGPNLSKYKTCKYISFERSFTSGTEMFFEMPKNGVQRKTGKVDCLSFLGVSPGSRTCSAADAHVD